ncbi:MAG: hypothetical protein FWG07_10675 [Treponema sp.]|nr:hypothetical protein [Treponema sp.]
MTLTLEELLVLFPLLKKNEALLNIKERQILVKLEKKLYEQLSIEEIEDRLGETIVCT